MPVVLDRGSSGQLLLGARRGAGVSDFLPTGGLELALINNMPDQALDATERQFVGLLAAASGDMLVRIKLVSLPDVPRAEAARRHVDEAYIGIGSLWEGQLDGLIVTGTEPRAATLPEEPYWAAMARLVDWAEYNTISTIWSCLAAHAAVLRADGIHRRRLAEKRSGVFECRTVSRHPLVAGMPRRFPMPHSRHNDLPENELAACGYVVASRTADAGVDSFVKRARSTFVFFQGHPEYDAETLYREYRRDVARFLKRERESYPRMPEGYFEAEAKERLTAFREIALAARSADTLAAFPAVEQSVANTWRASAVRFYRNWLAFIAAEKARSVKPLNDALPRRSAAAVLDGAGQLLAVKCEGVAPFVADGLPSIPATRARKPAMATAAVPAGRSKG